MAPQLRLPYSLCVCYMALGCELANAAIVYLPTVACALFVPWSIYSNLCATFILIWRSIDVRIRRRTCRRSDHSACARPSRASYPLGPGNFQSPAPVAAPARRTATPTESSHCDTAVAVMPGPFSAPRIQGELQHAAQACHKVDIWISSYLLLETRNLILLEHAGQGLSCLGAAPIRGPADGRRLDVNVDECKHADECTRGNNSRKHLMSSIQVFDFEKIKQLPRPFCFMQPAKASLRAIQIPSKSKQRNSGSHVEVEPVGVTIRLHHRLNLLPCILRLLKAPVRLQNADSTVS